MAKKATTRKKTSAVEEEIKVEEAIQETKQETVVEVPSKKEEETIEETKKVETPQEIEVPKESSPIMEEERPLVKRPKTILHGFTSVWNGLTVEY